jgi:hypothetical protein
MIIPLLILSFSIGEKLEYDAKYSFLTLGEMILEVRDTLTYEDADCYLISSVLNSASAFRFLFSIDDTIEVYTGVDDLLPYLYQERINESGYQRVSNWYFDHTTLTVTYDDSLEFSIAPDTRDMLSLWYYLRRVPLNIGDTLVFDLHNAQQNYQIFCSVLGWQETKTKAGQFNTTLVNIQTEGEGVFGAKGGMEIWYSEAERLPVQIKASMKFGSVLFKLREVSH